MKGEFSINWGKDDLADGYIVGYQTEEGFTELVRVENIGITSIIVFEMKDGVENHFKVCFYQNKDQRRYVYKEENFYCFATKGGLVTYRFSIPKLKKAVWEDDFVVVRWEGVSEGINYAISRREPKGMWSRIGMTKETTYIDRDIDMNKKYIYTVRCVSDDGKISLSSCSYKGISA